MNYYPFINEFVYDKDYCVQMIIDGLTDQRIFGDSLQDSSYALYDCLNNKIVLLFLTHDVYLQLVYHL